MLIWKEKEVSEKSKVLDTSIKPSLELERCQLPLAGLVSHNILSTAYCSAIGCARTSTWSVHVLSGIFKHLCGLLKAAASEDTELLGTQPEWAVHPLFPLCIHFSMFLTRWRELLPASDKCTEIGWLCHKFSCNYIVIFLSILNLLSKFMSASKTFSYNYSLL